MPHLFSSPTNTFVGVGCAGTCCAWTHVLRLDHCVHGTARPVHRAATPSIYEEGKTTSNQSSTSRVLVRLGSQKRNYHGQRTRHSLAANRRGEQCEGEGHGACRRTLLTVNGAEKQKREIEREPSILLNKMWPKADLRQPLLPPYTCTRIIYY